MARLYSGTTREFLADFDVRENAYLSFRYLLLAAERGVKQAIPHVASMYQTGVVGLDPDWPAACQWYAKYWDTNPPAREDFLFYGFDESCPPDYMISAGQADMYKEGGHGLEADLEKAAELYNEAADLAMSAMKGKIANQFFEKAAECG